jgi:hypothetical protein
MMDESEGRSRRERQGKTGRKKSGALTRDAEEQQQESSMSRLGF